MTNRRDFIVKFAMAGGAVSFLRPLNMLAGIDAKVPSFSCAGKLTILHTANIEGQVSALGMNEKMPGLGGLENIAREVARIRKETASVLAIDAGNLIGRGFIEKEEHFEFSKKVSDIGYDAVIPGQAESAGGIIGFSQLISETHLNVISCKNNFSTAATLPYSIIKKGQTRIGIINAGTAALKASHNTSALYAAAAMNQTAEVLRDAKRCTLIICVVQSSAEKCSQLASISSGIDVMISSAEKSFIHNTEIVRNQSNHEVLLSYAGAKGTMMSRLDFTFNEWGKNINVASKRIFAGAENKSYVDILKRCAIYSA